MSRDSRRKPERPVWSHKTEEGFLERFLKGETEEDALTPSSSEAPDAETSSAPAGDTSDATLPAASATARAPAEADSEPDAAAGGPAALKERVIAVLRQIYDPEIPVNLYDLGLIYGIDVSDDGEVDVTMTLTTPHCPVAESMPYEVETKLLSIEGVKDVRVHLVWDPPWDMSRMSDEARLELGLL